MSDGAATLALPGGRSLTVRPARPDDINGLLELYGSLSVEDRRRRFFTVSRPPRVLLERFLDCSANDRAWFVAVSEDGAVVADAGYTILPDGDAEFALTVRQDWRGWLGPYLLDLLRRDAAEHGVANLQADILFENRPMLTPVERRGYASIDEPDGTIIRVLISTRPGPSDLAAQHSPPPAAR
jgi:hypothetical protein